MKNVLVVDDLPQNVYMLEVLLTTNGYKVSKAANGLEGLELARKDPPDLIISDILMPIMDGFAFCRSCKTDEKLRQIPFVLLSATYMDEKDGKLALDIGADRFLTKPFEPDEFLALLKQLLEEQKVSSGTLTQRPLPEEEVYYKEYNEALVRKLEDKMLELQKANKHLTSLYEASCEMLSIKSYEELVHIILRSIVQTAGFQQANFYLYNEKTNMLSLDDVEGTSVETLERKTKLQFALGEPRGIVGMVAQTRRTLSIKDVSQEPNWIIIDPTFKSALFTPVVFEKKLLGVLALYSRKTSAFDDDDVHEIAVIANNLAVAMVNVRSILNAQRQLEKISALHAIDIAINGSHNLYNMLDVVIKQVIGQLKADAADILICQGSKSTCKLAASSGFFKPAPIPSFVILEKGLSQKVGRECRVVTQPMLAAEQLSPGGAETLRREKFVSYVGAPLVASGTLVGVIEVFMRSEFTPDEEWLSFFETVAGQAALAIDKNSILEGLQNSNAELIQAYDETIAGWSRALDLRDHETEGHTQRVTELTMRMAKLLKISEEEIDHIRRGALLHDIGKLGVPDHILLKTSELTNEEWLTMRKHPQSAYELLHPIAYLQPALDIPYNHHERWDGSGYPRGLNGEEIPLSARIFAIIDVYDALCSDRPYRKAWPKAKAIEYIRDQAGKDFDPKIVEVFINMISQGIHP